MLEEKKDPFPNEVIAEWDVAKETISEAEVLPQAIVNAWNKKLLNLKIGDQVLWRPVSSLGKPKIREVMSVVWDHQGPRSDAVIHLRQDL
jgi:hypothetical protein